MSAIVRADAVERGHRRLQAFATRERAARVTGAIESTARRSCRRDPRRPVSTMHVERLGSRDAELVDGDRMHVLSVGGDHRHLQAGDAHVEVAHRRAVDEPQPHVLAGAEESGPVAGRRAPFIRYVYA